VGKLEDFEDPAKPENDLESFSGGAPDGAGKPGGYEVALNPKDFPAGWQSVPEGFWNPLPVESG
jgi:hypothetical protein